MSQETVAIVLAWAELKHLPTQSRDDVRWDLGERPEYHTVPVPRAAVWLLKGSQADVIKAQAFAATQSEENMAVFIYPVDEPYPLKRARADVLQRGK